jgi:hypothetical protein
MRLLGLTAIPKQRALTHLPVPLASNSRASAEAHPLALNHCWLRCEELASAALSARRISKYIE